MRSATRASSASISGGACASAWMVSAPHAAARRKSLRANIPLILVLRGIGHAQLDERIVPLAAFAAQTAVTRGCGIRNSGFDSRLPIPESWAHARKCEFERDAELDPPCDDLRLARTGVGRVDPQIVCEPQCQRASHGGAKLGRRVGKRVVFQRAEDQTIELRGGAVHAGLAEEDDVAARQVDV